MADFRFYLNRQGPKGEQGVKGDKGFSPQVNIGKNTANEFTLLVTNEYDTFETPNLRGDQIENRGGTYVRYDQDNNKLYAADADHATDSQYGIVQIAKDSDIELGAEDKVVTAGQLQEALGSITTHITEVNDGTLTINYGQDVVGTFSANQATSTTLTIPKTEVDPPNNGKLTINYGTTQIGAFTANQSTDSVVNIPESEGVTVDNALSVTSTNPVENKVITSTINTLTTDINNVVSSTSALNATVTQHTEDISGLSTDLDNVSATVSNLGRDVTNLTDLCSENSTAIGSLQNTITTKADTSSLSAVALTGEYSDLLNPPEIPVVNNSTITLSDGESTLASFTLNQATDATITIPKGETIVTDNALNVESTNPIQNKPVAEAVNSLTASIGDVNTALANKADKSEIPSINIATTTSVGTVKPDGTTITVAEDGTISAVGSAPDNMVTLDTLQTISERKKFTGTTQIRQEVSFGSSGNYLENTLNSQGGKSFTRYSWNNTDFGGGNPYGAVIDMAACCTGTQGESQIPIMGLVVNSNNSYNTDLGLYARGTQGKVVLQSRANTSEPVFRVGNYYDPRNDHTDYTILSTNTEGVGLTFDTNNSKSRASVNVDGSTIGINESNQLTVLSSGGAAIDDATTSTGSVWSSSKTNEQIQVGNIATLETCTESFIHNNNVIQGEGVVITTTTITETTETSTVNSTQLTIGINYNTTPATTTATASKTSPSVVIDEFVSGDGTSGYRTWSNGYCEQWGMFNNNSNAGVHGSVYLIQLLKKYRDLHYNVVSSHTSVKTETTCVYFNVVWTGSTPDKFAIQFGAVSGGAYVFNFYWKACGYLAQGEY